MHLAKSNFYTFEVDKETTKATIEKVVSNKFKVDVVSVKVINTAAKRKLQRTRKGYFTTPSFKKAIVKLKSGQKIPLFESVAKEEEAQVTTAESVETKVKEKKSLLRGTKVRIEEDKHSSLIDREKEEKQSDPKRPTKRSQKEKKK